MAPSGRIPVSLRGVLPNAQIATYNLATLAWTAACTFFWRTDRFGWDGKTFGELACWPLAWRVAPVSFHNSFLALAATGRTTPSQNILSHGVLDAVLRTHLKFLSHHLCEKRMQHPRQQSGLEQTWAKWLRIWFPRLLPLEPRSPWTPGQVVLRCVGTPKSSSLKRNHPYWHRHHLQTLHLVAASPAPPRTPTPARRHSSPRTGLCEWREGPEVPGEAVEDHLLSKNVDVALALLDRLGNRVLRIDDQPLRRNAIAQCHRHDSTFQMETGYCGALRRGRKAPIPQIRNSTGNQCVRRNATLRLHTPQWSRRGWGRDDGARLCARPLALRKLLLSNLPHGRKQPTTNTLPKTKRAPARPTRRRCNSLQQHAERTHRSRSLSSRR